MFCVSVRRSAEEGIFFRGGRPERLLDIGSPQEREKKERVLVCAVIHSRACID